ncbi:MAG: caspase family protein [Xanthobacteraceae bacterium]
MTGPNSCVVPANAGTDNHRRLWLRKVSTNVPNTNGTAYGSRQLRLVILDACRDNPFTRTMKRTIGSRAIGRGLAKVEPSSPNTMIAFAAKAGSTVSDGDSKNNSPFAISLVEHLAKPGLDLRKAFGFVRDDVLKATNNMQEPFVYGSLGGNDVTLVPAAPAAAVASVDQDATMRRDYELALQIGTRPVWDSFVAKHPWGFYADLAKAQRDKLAAEAARIEATNKAKAALEEQSRLAAEGAKAAEQAMAAEQAKAAEKARIAAELAKKAEEAKVAEAERLKTAAMAKAAEDAKIAAAAQAKAAENAKAAPEAEAAEKGKEKAKEEKVAALPTNCQRVQPQNRRQVSVHGGITN